MWFFSKNIGLIDGVKDRRVGILFIDKSYANTYYIRNKDASYNIVIEVREIYNDKVFSKIEVIKIAFNKSDYKNSEVISKLNPWIESKNIYWLSPSTEVNRDNKINDILK